MDLAQRMLPRFDFEERHRLVGIRASARAVLRAIENFDDRADPWIDVAIRLREWPGRVLGRFSTTLSIAPRRERFGLADFTLLQKTDREIAYGLVGRFWRLDYGLQTCADARGFRGSDGRGLCRLALTFRIVETSGDTLELET
jgi:hypothetical protein